MIRNRNTPIAEAYPSLWNRNPDRYRLITRVDVLFPGPPPVRTNGCTNTWKDVIKVIVVAKKIAGEIIGILIRKNC
jgi:hypothetical protein